MKSTAQYDDLGRRSTQPEGLKGQKMLSMDEKRAKRLRRLIAAGKWKGELPPLSLLFPHTQRVDLSTAEAQTINEMRAAFAVKGQPEEALYLRQAMRDPEVKRHLSGPRNRK